jgi:hypothetical protein
MEPHAFTSRQGRTTLDRIVGVSGFEIVFDGSFDGGAWPGPRAASFGEAWLGPQGLLTPCWLPMSSSWITMHHAALR